MHIKDSMEQTENYRPISLLRIISKVLERWVSIKLYNHGKQFISPLQHGFLRNRFCTTQLLSVNAISRNLDKNIQTEVIYMDLAKAFDSVDHWVPFFKFLFMSFIGKASVKQSLVKRSDHTANFPTGLKSFLSMDTNLFHFNLTLPESGELWIEIPNSSFFTFPQSWTTQRLPGILSL